MRDFNYRIGAMDITNPLTKIKTRSSQDQMSNNKGVKFFNTCAKNSLLILNGKTKGDEAGKLTYSSTIGSSVIEYGIINPSLLQHTESFEILDWHESDHFPLKCTTGQTLTPTTSETYKVIKWDNTRKKQFQKIL